ncbi:MAG: hypothetical protein ACTSR8_22390 [Promethearchaeota archaeon]
MKIIMSYLQEDEKLKTCLHSLKKYSPNVEIVKLHSDPKKTKSSEHAFDTYFEEHGMDDDYMIWHPDMIATEGWYEKLMEYYDLFDVIGCKLVYPNGLIQHYGGALYPGQTIAGPGAVGGHPHQHSMNIGLNEPLSCPYVTGPSMVVKKKVWEKLKGWDHSYWCYIDADFCIRALKEGFTVGVVPVTLIHSEGEDQLKKRTKEYNAKLLSEGCVIFTSKHMDYLSKFK